MGGWKFAWAGAAVALLLVGGCSADISEGQAGETRPAASPSAPNPDLPPEPTPTEVVAAEDIEIPIAAWVSGRSAISGDSICIAWGDLARFNDDGLQAIIEDESGATIGVATMSPAEQYEGGCLREATVTVPGDREFYQLRMGPWESAVVARHDLTDETFRLQLGR